MSRLIAVFQHIVRCDGQGIKFPALSQKRDKDGAATRLFSGKAGPAPPGK